MDTYKLELFKTEIANQCRFVLLAADDIERYFQQGNHVSQQYNQAASTHDYSQLFNLQFPQPQSLWTAVYSLLTAAANISKHLWPLERDIKEKSRNKEDAAYLRKHLAIEDTFALSPYVKPSVREMRDHFEHFDARLEKSTQQEQSYIDSNIGPLRTMIVSESNIPIVPMRHFDTDQWAVIFKEQALPIKPVIAAARSLEQKINEDNSTLQRYKSRHVKER